MFKSWPLLIMSACFFVSCHSTKSVSGNASKYPGTWQATPIVIDGVNNDWPSPYPSYDAKTYLGYAVSNDKDNLYITIETGDEKTQMKIANAGLTVYIDTTGHKDQSIAIAYPLPNVDAPINFSKEKQNDYENGNDITIGNSKIRKIKRAMQNATQLTLQGFNGCNGGYSIIQSNNCGIIVRMKMDEYNELIWEAAIPFKALYGKAAISKSDAGKPLSICFAIKGIKKPKSTNDPNAANNDQTINGAATAGDMRGSMHGGRGAAMGQEDYLSENTKTWRQFSIAYRGM